MAKKSARGRVEWACYDIRKVQPEGLADCEKFQETIKDPNWDGIKNDMGHVVAYRDIYSLMSDGQILRRSVLVYCDRGKRETAARDNPGSWKLYRKFKPEAIAKGREHLIGVFKGMFKPTDETVGRVTTFSDRTKTS